jgi:hypothetical protein
MRLTWLLASLFSFLPFFGRIYLIEILAIHGSSTKLDILTIELAPGYGLYSFLFIFLFLPSSRYPRNRL